MREKLKRQMHIGQASYLLISRADYSIEISEAVDQGPFRRLIINQKTAYDLLKNIGVAFAEAIKNQLDTAQRLGDARLFLDKRA